MMISENSSHNFFLEPRPRFLLDMRGRSAELLHIANIKRPGHLDEPRICGGPPVDRLQGVPAGDVPRGGFHQDFGLHVVCQLVT